MSASSAVVGLASPVAAATTTFTWSGADEIAHGTTTFSDPANWVGGVAPSAGSPVKLVFPSLDCVVSATCNVADDDVPGLVASALNVTEPTDDSRSSSAPVYHLEGVKLTLAGPVDAVETPVQQYAEPNVPLLWLDLPVKISASDTWNVDTVEVFATDVFGTDVTVDETRGGSAYVGDVWALGHLTVTSDGTGIADYSLAIPASSHGTIIDSHTAAVMTPSSLASLVVEGSYFSLRSGTYDNPNQTKLSGRASFDSGTTLELAQIGPWATTPTYNNTGTYSQLVASGPISLGNAKLAPVVDCGTPAGAVFTVLSGSKITGHLDNLRGTAVVDGATVPAADARNCAPYYRPGIFTVHYTTTTVSLTYSGSIPTHQSSRG